jgi:hypothetical protein
MQKDPNPRRETEWKRYEWQSTTVHPVADILLHHLRHHNAGRAHQIGHLQHTDLLPRGDELGVPVPSAQR